MKIPPEIRNKISKLDELAGSILEWMEDNDFRDTDDQGDEDLMNELESLQNEITTFQEAQGWLDSPDWNDLYKKYEEVEIGDKAYQSEEPDQYIGTVVWKGTYEELEKSEHKELISDWDDDESGIGITTYDLVVVQEDGFDNLLNYDNDPAGCIVKKE